MMRDEPTAENYCGKIDLQESAHLGNGRMPGRMLKKAVSKATADGSTGGVASGLR